MTTKLTDEYIESLSCPQGRRDMMVFDAKQAGLGVRVTASGRKTFLAQYTLAGVRRRIPLGSCAAISLDDAREIVREIMCEVARGRDPALERKGAAASTERMATHAAPTLDA